MSAYEPAHRDDVLALYAEVFGAEAAAQFARRWSWFTEQNPVAAAAPAFVLLDGPHVAGFVATVAQRYLADGRSFVAHSTADYMVSPAQRFHGVSLMKECLKRCPYGVSLDDMPATIAVLKFFKFSSVARMERYVKVLDARFAQARRPALARVPAVAWRAAERALWVRDRLVGARASTANVIQLPKFDERLDRFFERRRAGVALDKSAAYLRWRYGESSPQRAARLFAVVDSAGELSGYIVTSLSSDAERTGFILELELARGAGEDAAFALLSRAVESLRREGAWLVRYHRLATGAVSHALLRRLGFSRREATHDLMVRLPDAALAASATDGSWNFHFGDAEPSYGAVLAGLRTERAT